jgi:succinyl-CoA synthetase alpha subunit
VGERIRVDDAHFIDAEPGRGFMAVKLDAGSRIIAVGASGPYGGAQIAFMQSAGTRVVAAAMLGRGGERMASDIPVHDHIADAVAEGHADTAMVYTPAMGAGQVIMDCADAGIRLAAVAAEFVPVHDALYAIDYARERGMLVVGPNTVGISSPGKAMLGAIAPNFTKAGRVGLIGRSGTLTMTVARTLSLRGIGQSTIVHIGGDGVTGGNPDEWLKFFLADPETDVIAYVGEIGGTKEYAMLDIIAQASKPIAAMIVGRHAPPGRRMGHAGAIVSGERETAAAKISALKESGAFLASGPCALVDVVASILRSYARTQLSADPECT